MQTQQRNCSLVVCLFILFTAQSLLLHAATLPVNASNNNKLNSPALNNKALTDISVTNAVIYVPLGNSQTTIAFFTLHNNSTQPIAITKVTSQAVKKIVLVPAIPMAVDTVNPWLILAHETLELKPANQHLQLTGLKNSLVTGDELQLDVSLSNGKKLLLIARAKSAFDQIHGH